MASQISIRLMSRRRSERISVIRRCAVAISGFMMLLACSVPLLAGSNTWPGPQGQSYAALGKLPDWSGTWAMPDRERSTFLNSPAAAAPYIEGYATRSKPTVANPAMCVTTGMPGVMAVPLGFEFLFTPGRVTILAEEGPTIRRVFTDGRAHSSDPDLTYAGESIGHWEGATLVVGDDEDAARKGEPKDFPRVERAQGSTGASLLDSESDLMGRPSNRDSGKLGTKYLKINQDGWTLHEYKPTAAWIARFQLRRSTPCRGLGLPSSEQSASSHA